VVFHRETYHPTNFSEIERYDQRLAELDAGSAVPESLWSRRTANRLSRTGSLAQAARQLGFKFE
jgi:hypothetical protein